MQQEPNKLKELYSLYEENGLLGGAEYELFESADDEQKKQLFDLAASNNILGDVDYDTFSSAWGQKKKTQAIPDTIAQPSDSSDLPLPSVEKGKDDYLTDIQNNRNKYYALSADKYQLEKKIESFNDKKNDKGEYVFENDEELNNFNTIVDEYKSLVNEENKIIDNENTLLTEYKTKFKDQPEEKKEDLGGAKDWLGKAWNSTIEGISHFSNNFTRGTGLNDEKNMASFIQENKDKYPELYANYQKNIDQRNPALLAFISMPKEKQFEIGDRAEVFRRKKAGEEAVEELGVNIDEQISRNIEETFFGGAISGLAKSIPAMALSSATLGMSFFDQSYQDAEQKLVELEDRGMGDISRSDKETYKLINAAASLALERVGLSNVIKGSSLTKKAADHFGSKVFNRIAMEAAEDPTKKITKEGFDRILNEEASEFVKYLKRTGQAGLSEFETGALQNLSTDLTEQGINAINGREIFDSKTAGQIAYDAIYSGGQEMFGGFAMGATLNILNNENPTIDEKNEFIELVSSDKNFDNMSKELSKEAKENTIAGRKAKQALEKITEYRKAIEVAPKNLSKKDKVYVVDLLRKKQQLQKEMDSKDDAFKKPFEKRINEINDLLSKVEIPTDQPVQETEAFSETEQQVESEQQKQDTDAVQERETTEVPSQPETQPIQEVEGEVRGEREGQEGTQEGRGKDEGPQTTQEEQVQEIEQRRQVELFNAPNEMLIAPMISDGKGGFIANPEIAKAREVKEKINAKYDAELKALESTQTTSVVSEPTPMPSAPKQGVFLDIEMIVGKEGKKLSEKEVTDAIPFDEFELENDGKNLRIKIPRELSSTEMMSLMKATGQEAIGQVVNGSGRLFAQSQELLNDYGGAFNPEFFKLPQQTKKIKKDEKIKAGNRLFNKPVKAVKGIADKYFKRVFGGKRPEFKGTTKLDKERAKRISDAFEAMEDNPNDPEVRAAYNKMAEEVIEQYKDFIGEGYVVEINNEEPYANSQEMIDDLENNKRMKIFSTESGFGDAGITDEQRKNNPLLAKTQYADVNGKPLLVNDLFRAVHDFFGHAELGNSFGPLGEENAWNVHARMFSPLARRAMTTETRGQNSYVNFSGVNEEAFKLRDKARKLREEGKEKEANEVAQQVYEMMRFADQKVGLLPEEFSKIDIQDEIQEEVRFAFEDKGSPLKRATDFIKKIFSSQRTKMNEDIYQKDKDRKGMLSSQIKIVENTSKDLRRVSKEEGVSDEDINLALRGEKPMSDLPPKTSTVVQAMRNQIDALTRMAIDLGLVEGDLVAQYEDGIGSYLTRSYRVFDDADWAKKITPQVRSKAFTLLRNEYKDEVTKEVLAQNPNATKKQIEDAIRNRVINKMDELLDRDRNEFRKLARVGSKDLSVLKARKDISPEIRALMGEYTDPIQNYAKTVFRMASFVSNGKFLNELKDVGLGKFLFEKNDPNRPKGFFREIAAEGSETMSPLNGLYTSPEIAEQLQQVSETVPEWLGAYLKAMATVKYTKTILSYTTHIKNVTGNIGFLIMSGNLSLNGWIDAIKVVLEGNGFTKKGKKWKLENSAKFREKYEEYQKLGTVSQSTGIGEMRSLINQSDMDNFVFQRKGLNKFQRLSNKVNRGVRGIENLYQAEDDFFKVLAFENELSKRAEAVYNKPKEQLTKAEYDSLSREVADIIRDTYPTYDMVPDIVNFFKKFPVLGTFVSFQAESIRVLKNNAKIAAQDMTSDNPKIKSLGRQRLYGILAYGAIKTAIISSAMALVGVSDEEDEDVRLFVPPWMKNGDLIYLSNNNGKPIILDLSSSDPFGSTASALNVMQNFTGDVIENPDKIVDAPKAFAEALAEQLSTFVSEDILTEKLIQFAANVDEFGRPIYNEEEGFEEQAKDISLHFYDALEPGSVKSVKRYFDPKKDLTTELAASFLGLRAYEVDVEKQFGFSTREYYDRLQNAGRGYRSATYKDDISKSDLDKEYEESNQAVIGLLQEMNRYYEAAERLGISRGKLNKILEKNRINPRFRYQISTGDISDKQDLGGKKIGEGRTVKSRTTGGRIVGSR